MTESTSTRRRLRIAAEWPPSDTMQPSFTVTLTLPRARGGARSDEGPTQLVRCALSVLQGTLEAAMADGRIVRADAARAAVAEAPWPRWCVEPPQVSALLASIAGRTDEELERLYPLSLWLVPAGNGGAERAIELFRSLPGDDSLWQQTIAAGVGRVALFDNLADVVVPVSDASQALGWVTKGAEAGRHQVEVEWRLEPS